MIVRHLVVIIMIATVSNLFGQNWSASISPDSAIAGFHGSWTVDVITGEDTLIEGGEIKIQFPSGWLNSPWPEGKLKALQFENPGQNHYVGFSISNKNCSAKIEVVRQGIDNQFDRYNRSFVITLIEGKLLPGDKLSLYLLNTTPPITSEQHKVSIAYKKSKDAEYLPLKEFPSIKILPSAPERIQIIVPSQAVTGTETTFRVVVTDHFYNSTKFYEGTVSFKIDESISISPSKYKYNPGDNGTKEFEIRFSKPGIHTITVVDDFDLAPHSIKSNPINVTDVELEHNIYWGDLHSHSRNSKDGTGKAETAFMNARDVSVLDFYALTDHGAGDYDKEGNYWVGITEDEWKENKELVEKYYKSGKFVTLLGCEWSGKNPYGHHNVIYRDLDGKYFGEDIYRKVEEVWDLILPGNAMTIPHHTGIAWPSGGSPYTDWSLNINDSLRPAMEIYSLWGSGEYYLNSMSHERYFQRNFHSHNGPNYARDAWAFGHHVGVVGGSDEHTSHPGLEYGGLTAVLAKSLDRNSIFDAIQNRQTYTTTGQRILIDFQVNDEVMGSKVIIDENNYPQIKVSVVGTDIIDYIELLKFNGRQWNVLYEVEPNSIYYESEKTDYDFRDKAIYYVRLKQKNIVGNREVRAWTSPIWVYLDNKNIEQ